MCRGTKNCGPRCIYNFKEDALWPSHPRSHEAYMRDSGRHVRLCRLPDWHLSCMLCDIMHIALLGIMQWAAGGILWELCLDGQWPVPASGPWKVRMNHQLSCAYASFNAWLRRANLESSQPIFTCNRLCMENTDSWPYIKATAANTWKVSCWLAELCRSIADRDLGNASAQLRAAMMWGFVHVFYICRQAGMWLSDANAIEIDKGRRASLLAYAALSSNAAATVPPTARYPMKPKHHMWDHAQRHATRSRLNPAWRWAFADEDFVR